MKNTTIAHRLASLALFALLCVTPAILHAANGTWTNLAGGSWPNAVNWTNGIVPGGTDDVADFGILDLTAPTIVTFDGARTIGTLITDDIGLTGDTNWTFNTGSGGPITMAVSSGTPVISVLATNVGNIINPSTRINAEIAGTSGLDKQGPGMLLLSNPTNSISGTLNISAGVVGVTNNEALLNITNVTVAAGGQLMLGDLAAAGLTVTFGKPITIAGAGPNLGALFIRGNTTTGVVTNPITLSAAARLGVFGVSATGRYEGGLTGTGPLTLHGQGGLSNHVVRIEVRSPFTHSGDTIIGTSAASNTVAIYGNDYLPTTSVLRLEPTANNNFTHFALNGFNQTLGGLSSTAGAGTTRRVINGSATPAILTVNDAGNRTYSGVLGGGGANFNNFQVIKQGGGVWAASGANSFTNGLWIQGGQASFGGGANVFAGGILIDSGAELRINGGGNVGNNAITNNGSVLLDYTISKTLNNVISGTGSVTVKGTGSGIAILGGTNTYTGATTINGLVGGRLNISSSKQLGGGDLIIGDAVTNGITVDVAGLRLTNANFTIGSVFGGSTLEVGIGALGNPTVPVLHVGGVATLNAPSSLNTLILTGTSYTAGTFTLIKYGSLVGSISTFNPVVVTQPGIGATLIDTGTSIDVVLVSLAEEVWNGNLSTDWDAGTFNWTNRLAGNATNYTGTVPVRFDDGAVTTGVNLTLAVSPSLMTVSNVTKNYSFTNTGGVISGSGALTKQGAGRLTLAPGNDYAGNTTIQAGLLTISGSEAIPDGTGKGSFALNSTLDLAGFNETVNNLSGTGTVTNSGGAATFTVTSTSASTNAGVIRGALSLVKNGSSSLTLSGSNTFTGGTLVSIAGNLVLANSGGQCVPGNITISNNARLLLGAANQISDTALVIFADGATNNGRFQPVGFNETIGGIQDNAIAGNRIVEAATDGVHNAPSTLTLNVAGGQTYTHNNFIRNAAGGATNSALSLTKTGAGTQVFAGAAAFVSYSGTTVVDNGVLEFSGANSVANNSAMTLNGGFVQFSGGGTRTNTIAGGAGGLIKNGANTLTLAAANTYTGPTTVSNGTLLVTGSLGAGSTVSVITGGTLGGNGTILGPILVDAGATFAPGTNDIGILTVSNTLTLNATSETLIELNQSTATNDAVAGLTTVNFNGTLTVTNLAGTFVGGETYQLFSAGSYAGNFTVTNLPAITNTLVWNWNPANGTLAVASASVIATNPTNITFTAGGGSLSLSWPADHLGWFLQTQTNSRALGLSSNWVDVPGSDTLTATNFPTSPASPTVFFRLRNP